MSRRFWASSDSAPPLDAPQSRSPRDIFGGGGGGQTVQTNTIQNSDPWSGVQPYLSDVFQRGAILANQPYTGSFLSPSSPYTTRAIAQQAASVDDPNSLINRGGRELSRTISGDYLSIGNNPAAQEAINAARRTVSGKFSGDNYGSSANQEWLARAAAGAVTPILQQERQNQLNAMQLAPSYQAQNIGLLAASGAAEDTRNAAEVNAARTAYMEPWEQVFRYGRAIGGGAGAGGTTSTQGQQPYFSNPLAGALGLGIGGLSLYNGLNTAGLLGGLGGATAPGLSAGSLSMMFPAVETGLGLGGLELLAFM